MARWVLDLLAVVANVLVAAKDLTLVDRNNERQELHSLRSIAIILNMYFDLWTQYRYYELWFDECNT